MADEATQQGATTPSESGQDSGDSQSQTQNDQQNQNTNKESSEASAGQEKSEAGDDSGKTGEADATKGEKKEKSEFKPRSRRSAEYRINQLLEENEKLRKRSEAHKPKPDDGSVETADDGSEKPDIENLVEKAVEKRLKRITTVHSKAADESEINELFTGEMASKRAEYEPQIRKAWEHEAYSNMSAADLYKILAYDSAIEAAKAQAIEEYKKSLKESTEQSTGGSSAKTKGSKPKDWMQASTEEFIKEKNRVMSGGSA